MLFAKTGGYLIRNKSRKSIYVTFFKRLQDFVLAFSAIIFLSPLLIIISIIVRILIGKPIIYEQPRPGLNENIFVLYKFRTMTDEKISDGQMLPDADRLTKFGTFLRSTSLDELPELINIIKGEMSLVGPRPQLVRDLVFMSDEQRKRHQVLPGLTGLAQIGGRNEIIWEDKLLLDLEYIENISFFGDWKIMLKTVGKVFKRDGVTSSGFVTAEDYGDYLLRMGMIDFESYENKLEEAKKLLEMGYK